MKTCPKCGEKNFDLAVLCDKCKTPLSSQPIPKAEPSDYREPAPTPTQNYQDSQPQNTVYVQAPRRGHGLQIAAKIIMTIESAIYGEASVLCFLLWILALSSKSSLTETLAFAFLGFLIAFAIQVCMTVSYFGKTARKEPASLGFKLCVLIFSSKLAGAFMLCGED